MEGAPSLLHLDNDDFKSRLVNDVFGRESSKVPIDKVMMLIWQFRDDPSVVQFMAQFVTKYSGRRDVFDGIEFYLPQLAHMIIHLEANWDDAILERFALIIAQQSMHFALQLNWILQGAIQDYQPEMPDGQPNEKYHALYYTRCVKLLANIERTVVYGTPRTHELQRLYEKGQITKQEYDLLEQADRKFNAAQMTEFNDTGEMKLFGGFLLYKRLLRRSRWKRKNWKTRFFAVSERMLYCYNTHPSQGGRLVRAMPLEGAIIMETPKKEAKYPYMFDVHNLNFVFRMRSTSEEGMKRWMEVLMEERESHTLYPHQIGVSVNRTYDEEEKKSGDREDSDGSTGSGRHHQKQFMKDLTPAQKARYDFFKNERDFVRSLTNLAEELRFMERPARKLKAVELVAQMDTPSAVYVPLVNSSDIWRRVCSPIPKETRVFNTNERCPVVMYFLSKRGERMHHHRGGLKDVNLDVAEYLHLQYEVPDAAMNPIAEESSTNSFEVVNSSANSSMDDIVVMSMDSDDPRAYPGLKSVLWKDKEDSNLNLSNSKESMMHHPLASRDSSFGGRGTGNAQLRMLIREGFVTIPSKIKNRLPHHRRQRSRKILRNKLPLQSVPILENKSGEDDDASVISDFSGSILTAEGAQTSVEGPVERDGIDAESLARASKIICGDEKWQNRSERLLREFFEENKDNYMDRDTRAEVSGVMVKSNDDLRQEVFVMQMIHFYKSVFAKASLPIYLRTYRILSTSKDTGMIEFLYDTTSIDGLKKNKEFPVEGGLRAYFEKVYGPPEGDSFKAAQKNFMLSLVGYSLVSYLLGLKDRHNGNIMIDVRGRLIFIDFGFAMGMAPGHEFSFERAPFKLTQEYIDVMGGSSSPCYLEFQRLFVAGFEAARANSQIAIGLVEIMMYKSNYPCFSGSRYGGDKGLIRFQNRLMLHVPTKEIRQKALALIRTSKNHSGTWLYDRFQKYSNGYAM